MLLKRIWNRIVNSIVTEVPADLDYCEFECRATVCNDWAHCFIRLEHLDPTVQVEWAPEALIANKT